ncbi:MAG: YMGG-like glycine zipper-containing protein [Blastocatellales bacterium]
MKNRIFNNVMAMLLTFGLLFVAAAPSAMADGKKKNRRNVYSSNYYDDGRYDRNQRRNVNRYDRYDDDDYYYDRYRDREDTTGKALKRTGIGAGIGAVGGAVIGGKKGALIGAGIGAAGGYIYHRSKVNRDRNRRFPW